MKTLQFRGHSDDTFGEYGVFGDDYDCCASGKMIAFKVTDEAGEGLIVCGQYDGKQWPDGMPGCWVVGIQQLDEDWSLPDWPMRWSHDDYSIVLEIDAPDDVTIDCLNRKRR